MKLRKQVVLSCVLVLALLCACAHVQEGTVSQSATPALDRILKRGALVVGTAGGMPPLNMTTKDGRIIGLEADLAHAMANFMGVRLRFEVMPFRELLPALETGKVDMVLSGMTMTPQRNMKVAFVGPYFITGKSFLTKTKRLLSVKDAGGLNSPDTTLTALQGSTSQLFVEHAAPRARLVKALDYDEAVDMVIQGRVDALVADHPICVVSVLRHPDQGLAVLMTPLTYEPIGIALPAGDPLFVNWTENFLETFEGSGRLKAMKAWWLEDRSWLKELQER